MLTYVHNAATRWQGAALARRENSRSRVGRMFWGRIARMLDPFIVDLWEIDWHDLDQ